MMTPYQHQITVGYLRCNDDTFLSSRIIQADLVSFFGKYVDLKVFNMSHDKDVVEWFQSKKYEGVDYLLIDSFNYLVPCFLLRARYNAKISFITILHSIYVWLYKICFIIPLICRDDIIAVPSRYAASAFARISNAVTTAVLPYAIDYDRIAMIRSRIKKHDHEIAYCGRLVPQKGIKQLLTCCAHIRDHYPQTSLTLIGGSPVIQEQPHPAERFISQLKQYAAKRELQEKIVWAGILTGKKKYEQLSHATVFMNLSTGLEETFSIATLEALACGLPAIISDWQSHCEFVRDGINGLRCRVITPSHRQPYVNYRDVVNNTCQLFSDRKHYAFMQQEAYATAELFDYTRIFPDFVDTHLKTHQHGCIQPQWDLLEKTSLQDHHYLFSGQMGFFIMTDVVLRYMTYKQLADVLFFEPMRFDRSFLNMGYRMHSDLLTRPVFCKKIHTALRSYIVYGRE